MDFFGRLKCLLGLTALLASAGPALGNEVGVLSGRVSCADEKPCRGVASLWDASQGSMPDPRKFIIAPTVAVRLDPDGSFELRAPPGRYYLGAILRQSEGPDVGPPRAGDLVLMTPTEDGSGRLVDISTIEEKNVGVAGTGWVYEGFEEALSTGIQGQVVDREGQPVDGMLVFAFSNPEMSGRPQAVSEPTSAGGGFVLRLARPGTFYLCSREGHGPGLPVPGEYLGVFGDRKPAPVSVATDQVRTGLVVEVARLPETAGPVPRVKKR